MKQTLKFLFCIALLTCMSSVYAFWGYAPAPYYPAPVYPAYGYGYGYGPYYSGRVNKGAAIASGILGAGSLLASAASYRD